MYNIQGVNPQILSMLNELNINGLVEAEVTQLITDLSAIFKTVIAEEECKKESARVIKESWSQVADILPSTVSKDDLTRFISLAKSQVIRPYLNNKVRPLTEDDITLVSGMQTLLNS